MRETWTKRHIFTKRERERERERDIHTYTYLVASTAASRCFFYIERGGGSEEKPHEVPAVWEYEVRRVSECSVGEETQRQTYKYIYIRTVV